MRVPNPAVMAPRAALAVIALVALVALLGEGCSKKITSQLIPNEAPQVRLTGAPVMRDSLNPDFYAFTVQWMGYDPDGRVDHFLLAVDPPNPGAYDPSDTAWHVTARNESTFFFSAGKNYDPVNPRDPRAQTPHVLSIFAVDNQGMLSKEPASRGFFSFTQCPTVQISQPAPNAAFTPTVTPTVTFRWTGQDPDGQFTTKPRRWVFRLFGQKNPDLPRITDYISYALLHPDSLRAYYAPDFNGWTSVGGDTTTFQYHGLNPGSLYLFVVTGFDEAGAYDPVLAEGRNMLKFGVSFAGSSGPIIRMFNQFFDYVYPFGGHDESPERYFRIEVPALIPLTVNWIAAPPPGANIRRYRWIMSHANSPVDLTDDTPRTNEVTDWYHWSAWSLNTTSATVGPFVTNSDTYLFCIEAEDNNGLSSLGLLYFRVVQSTFENELLFVDDTRLRPDYAAAGGVAAPTGPWPTAAELDTFLYAKGGFEWRGYPAGTISSPGIFNGYPFDTIGTRGISADGTVPLSLLGRYQHVVWYVDQQSAVMNSQPSDRTSPITALRLVSSPGRPSILSTYLTQGYKTQGGHVWLCGGGSAFATLVSWNKTGTSPLDYDAREPNPELRPGRMMYDFVHWREGVQMLPARTAARYGTTTYGLPTDANGNPIPIVPDNRPGREWPPNPAPPTPSTAPDYLLLPASLDPKSTTTDPPPPLRQSNSFFYRTTYSAEYISRPTFVREDYNDDPDIEENFSTLDTLYITRGGTALPNSPVMTYYHGRENQPLIFSGFTFWYWQRSQCIQLVDWVLQDLWKITRDPTAPRNPTTPMAARRASR